jgi:hypothetical protein
MLAVLYLWTGTLLSCKLTCHAQQSACNAGDTHLQQESAGLGLQRDHFDTSLLTMQLQKPLAIGQFELASPRGQRHLPYLKSESSRERKKRVLPGSPWRPLRPRSWLSMRRDS